jgi:transposase-like protein
MVDLMSLDPSHMTYGSPVPDPIVPPAREGHRRRFNEADKCRIVEEASQAGASLSEVARRYGILRAYAAYYNKIRTHRSLDKDAPDSRADRNH